MNRLSTAPRTQPRMARTWLCRASALALALSAWVAVPAAAQSVPTLAVQPRAVSSAYALDGVVQAVKQSTVAAQASGRLVTLSVKAGDRVRAGQVIATIDDRETQTLVQRSQAQIAQADAELRNARASLERTRDLQAKGFVSKAALDAAETQHQGASAQREQALAAAKQSQLAQGFTKVTAPFDGWVLQTHTEAGELAFPGKPILSLYAPQPLRVVVQVPASRAVAVRSASDTVVEVDSTGGTVQRITPTARTAVPSADPVSQTTEWRFDLPARDSAELVPGQQVRVQFGQASSGQKAKLIIPEAALLRRGELTAVYVAAGSGFALRAVRVGGRSGSDSVEILAGLGSGETIALDPIRAGLASGKSASAGK